MYEFSDDEAETMWLFGNKLTILGLLMVIGGILGIAMGFLSFDQSDKTRVMIQLIEAIFLVIIGIVLFRPSDNFKNIAISEGKDIPELMQGVFEFTQAFLISAGCIAAIGFLNLVLMINKI